MREQVLGDLPISGFSSTTNHVLTAVCLIQHARRGTHIFHPSGLAARALSLLFRPAVRYKSAGRHAPIVTYVTKDPLESLLPPSISRSRTTLRFSAIQWVASRRGWSWLVQTIPLFATPSSSRIRRSCKQVIEEPQVQVEADARDASGEFGLDEAQGLEQDAATTTQLRQR
ncbi:hypothetical protein ONZ45_g15037 [Pleurotus djamor]|nr:hypothetical protein ONZ45_g15037 [Pleurotus djamor]